MCGFSSLNSRDSRYFENSDSQSSAFMGGRDPVTGRHSVMLKLRETTVDQHLHPLCITNNPNARIDVPRFSQPSQTTKYNNTKNADRAAQQPVCNRLVADLREARFPLRRTTFLSPVGHCRRPRRLPQIMREQLLGLRVQDCRAVSPASPSKGQTCELSAERGFGRIILAA